MTALLYFLPQFKRKEIHNDISLGIKQLFYSEAYVIILLHVDRDGGGFYARGGSLERQ